MLKIAFIGLAIAGFTAGWQQAGRDFDAVHARAHPLSVAAPMGAAAQLRQASGLLPASDRWVVEEHRRANLQFKRDAQQCASVAATLRADCLWRAERRHDARTAAALRRYHAAFVMPEAI